MRSGRHPTQTDVHRQDREDKLIQQVAALEDRVRLLEARLLRLAAAQAAAAAPPGTPPRVTKPAPRCPGCRLELPRGRRKVDTCVWCGFRFDAVRPRVTGQATK